MSLKKKIINLEKRILPDELETDELAKFLGNNIMGVVAKCMIYHEQHGCFPPDIPEKLREILSEDRGEGWDELYKLPDIRT